MATRFSFKNTLQVKSIFIFILLTYSNLLSAQYTPSNHSTYIGVSIGTGSENYARIEHDVRDKYMILQGTLLFGEIVGFQYKLGAGYIGKSFRVYAYMPYFNMNITKFGYNTPFGVEAFFGDGDIQASINLDIYTIGVVIVPSVRIRYRIIKFRL